MINVDYLIALSGIVFVLMHYSKELVLKPAKARFNVPDNYYVYGLTLAPVNAVAEPAARRSRETAR